MYDHIQTMHMGLQNGRVIRLVLLPKDWELTIKEDDEIWDDCDGKVLVIEHENGERVLVNIDHITFVCTMASARRYYE